MRRYFTVWLAMASLFSAADAVAADATRGEKLYGSRCAGCHSIDRNRIGPLHRGVHGREAGTVADFNYSPALRQSNVIWDDASLDAWLSNPQAFIPGQRMFFSLKKAEDRADVIAYLRQLSAD